MWRAREAPCPQPPRESCGKPVETRGPRLPPGVAWIQGVYPGKRPVSRLSPGDEQAVESLGSKVPTACGGPPHNLWIACGMDVKRLGSKLFSPHRGATLDMPEKRRSMPLFPVDRLGSKGVILFSGPENTHTLGINLWPTSVDPRGLPWGNGVGSHLGREQTIRISTVSPPVTQGPVERIPQGSKALAGLSPLSTGQTTTTISFLKISGSDLRREANPGLARLGSNVVSWFRGLALGRRSQGRKNQGKK